VKRRWYAAIFLAAMALVLLALWLVRTYVAVQFARSYFQSHGVASSVEIGELGLSGVSARFALGPAEVPEISAERIELHFDPLRWLPYVTEVRLVHPVVRARLDDSANLTLGSLQNWIDSLRRQQGKSRYVSDDLAVSLRGLRLLLATPAGPLDVGGDVELRKGVPVSLALTAQPAHIHYRDADVTLTAASLAHDRKAETLVARFAGTVKMPSSEAQQVQAEANSKGFRWTMAGNQLSIAAPFVSLHMTAASATAGQVLTAPQLDVTLRNLSAASGEEGLGGAADISVSARVGLDVSLTALQNADRPLANALRQNLKHLTMNFAGHAERRDGMIRLASHEPLHVSGARGGVLDISALTLSGGPDSLHAALDAELKGPNIPPVKVTIKDLLWSGGGFTSQANFSSRFNFAMLRGVDLAGSTDPDGDVRALSARAQPVGTRADL